MAMLIYTVFCYTNLSTVNVRLIDAHGGSAIFISPEINYTRRLDLSIDIPYCESVWAEIEQPYFTYNRKKQILASIYHSHSSSLAEFLSALETVLNSSSLENKSILLVGDININFLDSNTSSIAAYTDCLSGYGFTCLIHSHTRCGIRRAHTLLDHASSNFNPQASGVVNVDITNHYLIFVTFDSPVASINTFNITHLRSRKFYYCYFSL